MLKGRALRGVEGSAQRASVLAGRMGVNMANKGGGQDLRAMWKLYHVHWPLSACTGLPAKLLANKQRLAVQFITKTTSAPISKKSVKNEVCWQTEARFILTAHYWPLMKYLIKASLMDQLMRLLPDHSYIKTAWKTWPDFWFSLNILPSL